MSIDIENDIDISMSNEDVHHDYIIHYVYKGELVEIVPSNVTSLSIDPSVTIITDGAISDHYALTTVEIPNTVVAIGLNSFLRCTSLTNINIPDSVQMIGQYAFHGCTALKYMKLPHGMRVISHAIFGVCSSLTTVVIPNTVEKIEEYAFEGCTSLTELHIPDSVREIGEYAFKGCTSLTTLNIPEAVKKIAITAFDECHSLSDFQFSHQNLTKYLNISTTRSQFTAKYLSIGPGPMYSFKGQTQHGYGPELCGITLEQMEELLEHPLILKTTTMRAVVENVIKPATNNCGMGYALLVNQNKPLRAKVMVSHAWDETFYSFVTSIKRSGLGGPFWVCAFSIYQNQGDEDHPTINEQLGSDPDHGPFATVLKQADLMVAVITDKCDIYTRLWCVYELHVARRLGVRVQLLPFISEEDELHGKVENDICISKINTVVDSENAYVWSPDDRRSIHAAITKESANGFNVVNEAIELIRLEYLLNYPIGKIMGGEKLSNDFSSSLFFRAFLLHLFVGSLLIIPLWGFGSVILFGAGSLFAYIPYRWSIAIGTIDLKYIASLLILYSFDFHHPTFGIGGITMAISMFTNVGRAELNTLQFLLDNELLQGRKEAAKKLSKAAESLCLRIGNGNHPIETFDNFCNSKDRHKSLFNRFPLMMYKVWTKLIEKQLDEMKKSRLESINTVPDSVISESRETPLLMV